MREILVIGMLDSVHLARWLNQFENSEIQITLFPSSKYRFLHPTIRNLLLSKNISLYRSSYLLRSKFSGYLDYFIFEFLKISRSKQLKKMILQNNFNLVHLIEIQHAGYLFIEANLPTERNFKVITTNYGSDLLFFKDMDADLVKISKLLNESDFYSAECHRDYHLAHTLGFRGVDLPCIPNSGGFSNDVFSQKLLPLSKRKTIYVKGYGERFGLGEISLEVVNQLLDEFREINVVIGSVTDDLQFKVKNLKLRYGERVSILPIRKSIPHDALLGILRQSILVIGASRSDGISTTFLEALVSGALPIQTNTSCAAEWTSKGFYGRVVPISKDAILKAATDILQDPKKYEDAVRNNVNLAKSMLSFDAIKSQAQTFYLAD